MTTQGQKITFQNGQINVPDQPIIALIEGDGIGSDITPVMQSVVSEAVKKAYGDAREIVWKEVLVGEKAHAQTGESLPQASLDTIKDCKVAIKGPLGTPIGGGFRSLNVAIRQVLDLHACIRPVRYFTGIESPVKKPELVDMVIFRENTEDIYAGIEWQAKSAESKQIIDYLQNSMAVKAIRFPQDCGVGVKVISREGSERLIRDAIKYALVNQRRSVTLVHKGNIMKYTEGAFLNWGIELAKREFGAYEDDGWCFIKREGQEPLVIKNVITDNFLQQILLSPQDFDIIATMNLNGDYISDALAAQVGGIGIAPGANVGKGVAVFEATHGTAPKHKGLDKVNPSSLILSAEMMLRHLGWTEAADCLIKGMKIALSGDKLTYDLTRHHETAHTVSCSAFGKLVVDGIRG